jgi:hypothetical protein
VCSSPASSPIFKNREELINALNRYSSKAPESQQVLVTAHNDLCIRLNRTLQNAVVRWVVSDPADALGRTDDSSDDAKLFVVL